MKSLVTLRDTVVVSSTLETKEELGLQRPALAPTTPRATKATVKIFETAIVID